MAEPRSFDEIHLGIACPMANEGAEGVRFARELMRACGRFPFRGVSFFAVVDRASRDDTRERLEEHARAEPRLRVVWAPENRCVVDAYLRGYREAMEAGCDWILEIDAGFSHDPAEAPQFFVKMAEGYDCVFGTRFGLGGRFADRSLKRRLVSRGGGMLTNLLLGTKLTDMTSGFELFTREALAMALAKGVESRAHFFQTEIKVACRNLRWAEVPITYRSPSPRLPGSAVSEALRRLGALTLRRIRGTL